MKTSLVVLGLAVAAFVAAPVMRAQDDAATFGDPAMMAAESAPPQVVTPQAVLGMIQDPKSNIALVDVQPEPGYVEGHIPGAMNYPWVMKISKFPIALPRNKTLILYGSCPNDTSDMAKKLAEFGYLNVKIMDGGWYKWVALKYPAAGTNPSPDPKTLPADEATPNQQSSQPKESEVSQLTSKPAKSTQPATAAK